MNASKHSIFGFVAPSGSGKSTLMLELLNRFEHLRIVKSTSTRSRRDRTDDYFYNLVSDNQFEKLISEQAFINYHKYAGFYYGTNRHSTLETLKTHCGMMALVENSVADIRHAGFDVRLIKIIPEKEGELARSNIRKAADIARASIPLDYELTITNSFQPGGLDRALQELSDYFTEALADH